MRKKKAEAEFLGEEIKRLQARKKALENAANGLKQYILYRFEKSGTDKVKGYTSSLSVKVSECVMLTVETSELPADCIRTTIKVEPDKAAIRAQLESGVVIDGAYIDRSRSLTVR